MSCEQAWRIVSFGLCKYGTLVVLPEEGLHGSFSFSEVVCSVVDVCVIFWCVFN